MLQLENANGDKYTEVLLNNIWPLIFVHVHYTLQDKRHFF